MITAIVNDDFITAINALSPYLREATATIASRHLNIDIEPSTLPLVRFTDNELTRANLDQLSPGTTVPIGIRVLPTPLGSFVDKISVHPDVIKQHVKDNADLFGGEEEATAQYAEKHRLSRKNAAGDLVSIATTHLVVNLSLRAFLDIQPEKITQEVLDLALRLRDSQR